MRQFRKKMELFTCPQFFYAPIPQKNGIIYLSPIFRGKEYFLSWLSVFAFPIIGTILGLYAVILFQLHDRRCRENEIAEPE